MIDWHTHILPGIDDGSKDKDESLTLIGMLAEQDIDTVVATPHFYANDESVNDFLERRRKSYESLLALLPENAPKILLGAEVRYYAGIGKLPELSRLCIEGGRLLLLEMPTERWTDYTVRELISIQSAGNVKLILAHIDRYLNLQTEQTWSKLYEAGILMQVNASVFTEFTSRRRAAAFLVSGKIHMIGSDCHSVKHRPPLLREAFQYIRKKTDIEFIDNFSEYGYSLLDLI